MDESVLLDLLECPVCLERLDASAKVLPCQHTFCRRCLQGIVGSRGELRCPECRTLVESGVDELPSNILLVRLLDGIKQRPRRPGGAAGPSAAAAAGAAGTVVAASCSTNGTAGGGAAARPPGVGPRGEQQQQQQQQQQGPSAAQPQRAQSKSTVVRGVPQLPCAKALYNYDGKEPGDLKFAKGDVIILRRQVDENWYHGEMGGVHGFFPTNFVQIMKPLPQPPPQVDENWAEGMLGDKIGIFPISYVEFNTAARQLVELDKPSDSDGGVEGPAAHGGGAPRGGGGGGEKKNTKKRHSFTSLTMSHKPSLAPPPQRHSMEISGPVLISSSNPTAAARIGELSGGLSCSAPSQVHICTSGLIVTPPPSSPVTTATVFTFPPETSYTSIHVSGRQRPTVYVAMFPYTPRKEDELELRKGEMFLVLERCQDGCQPKLPLTLSSQPGRSLTILAASSSSSSSSSSSVPASPGPDASKPLPPCPGPVGMPQAAVVATAAQTATGQQPKVIVHVNSQMTVNQARNAGRAGQSVYSASKAGLEGFTRSLAKEVASRGVIVHVNSQMTVNQARNAVRTAANHGQDRPTASVPPLQSAPPGAFLAYPAPAPCSGSAHGPSRVGVALGCASASLTPPNVSAASLDADGQRHLVGPGNGSLNNAGLPLSCRLDKDAKREKKGLLKLLSSNKKKSFIRTDMTAGLMQESAAQLLSIPLGRVGEVEEVAQAAVFLLLSPYVTGQALVVDGGVSLHM
ncbi:hypothetical protein CRUP_030683 [Coryphaenoides rupestris]|nr:hypothetical protein CRUP_030683 [Coryphaenoides rupestris]